MGSIRSDLVGVVFIQTDGGDVVRLSAGDEIPEGVVVGDHLIATEAEPVTEAFAEPVADADPEVVPAEVIDGADGIPVAEPAPKRTRAPRK